ncbi:MAG: hypothetical protein V5A46_04985 [Haloferacaceae archaeon]
MTDGEDGSVEAEREPAPELPVPDELETWLRDRVDGTDRSVEEELERIVSTHRLAVDGERSSDPTSVDSIENRLEETREEFQEGIEDVRERVIQVLEETHDRAERDHAHPEIEDDLVDACEELEALREELDALDGRLSDSEAGVDAVRSTVDANADRLDDLESRVGRLDDDHGEVESKLDRLASAVVRLRRRVERLEATAATEDRLDALREEANRAGVRVADCGECGRPVTVALLAEPRCPHCETAFAGVEPSRGFFRSSTLLTEDRPALEGRTVDDPTAEGSPDSLAGFAAGDGDSVAEGGNSAAGDEDSVSGDEDSAAGEEDPDDVADETDGADANGEPSGGRSSGRE